MNRSAPALAIATLLFIPLALRADDPAPDDAGGWRILFDGKSLDGWEMAGPGRLVLEDGLLRTEGGMGLLWYTKETFGDCQIRVTYKTNSKVANSGVFVRVAEPPKDPWIGVHKGYEIQICDGTDAYHRTGAVYSMAPAKTQPSKPLGEWNEMLITLKGKNIEVQVNGVKTTDFDPEQPVPERTKDWEPERGPRPAAGYIGLQNHDDYAGGTHVYFKEVAIRPLAK